MIDSAVDFANTIPINPLPRIGDQIRSVDFIIPSVTDVRLSIIVIDLAAILIYSEAVANFPKIK